VTRSSWWHRDPCRESLRDQRLAEDANEIRSPPILGALAYITRRATYSLLCSRVNAMSSARRSGVLAATVCSANGVDLRTFLRLDPDPGSVSTGSTALGPSPSLPRASLLLSKRAHHSAAAIKKRRSCLLQTLVSSFAEKYRSCRSVVGRGVVIAPGSRRHLREGWGSGCRY
jgi:hypothetical protein